MSRASDDQPMPNQGGARGTRESRSRRTRRRASEKHRSPQGTALGTGTKFLSPRRHSDSHRLLPVFSLFPPLLPPRLSHSYPVVQGQARSSWSLSPSRQLLLTDRLCRNALTMLPHPTRAPLLPEPYRFVLAHFPHDSHHFLLLPDECAQHTIRDSSKGSMGATSNGLPQRYVPFLVAVISVGID